MWVSIIPVSNIVVNKNGVLTKFYPKVGEIYKAELAGGSKLEKDKDSSYYDIYITDEDTYFGVWGGWINIVPDDEVREIRLNQLL